MANNLVIQWELPTQRESGKPLPVGSIDHVVIELSADGGVNYVELGTFGSDVLETVVSEIDYGTWFVRGRVFDTAGRASAYAVDSITRDDDTPPGPLVLTLSLA